MKGKIKIEFDRYELGTILNALREFRNIKIREEITTESIDDLLLKLINIYEHKCPLLTAMNHDLIR